MVIITMFKKTNKLALLATFDIPLSIRWREKFTKESITNSISPNRLCNPLSRDAPKRKCSENHRRARRQSWTIYTERTSSDSKSSRCSLPLSSSALAHLKAEESAIIFEGEDVVRDWEEVPLGCNEAPEVHGLSCDRKRTPITVGAYDHQYQLTTIFHSLLYSC